MKSRLFAIAIPAICATSLLGCSSAPMEDPTEVSTVTSEIVDCPTPGASDAEQRAVASLAYNLMRLTAKVGGPVSPVYSNSILAAQRYKIRSSGTGIEFRTTDKLFKYVTPEMQAILDLAQKEPEVARFLSDGQRAAYQTNGWFFPSVNAISALANFTSPGPTTVAITDLYSANNSHKATVTATQWCGAKKVLITETVQQSYAFTPLEKRQITNAAGFLNQTSPIGDWLNAPPAEFANPTNQPMNGNTAAATPFNGPSGNPYLVISLTTKGVTTNWSGYNWSMDNCYSYWPSQQCTGYLEIDPAPYAEPAAHYTTNASAQQIYVGTQANPFTISGSLYAAPEHRCDYAQRTLRTGATEVGRFATAVSTTVGTVTVTQYKYAQLASIPKGICP